MNEHTAGTLFTVGEPFPIDVPLFQGAILWLDPLLVAVCMSDLTPPEVKAFRQSKIKFYLQEIEDLLSLQLEIKNFGWAEALLAIQSASKTQTLEPLGPEPNIGYAVQVVLVDLDTRIVKAMRMIGLSSDFSEGLWAIFQTHKDDPPFSDREFIPRANAVMSRFSTPESLAERALFTYQSGEKS